MKLLGICCYLSTFGLGIWAEFLNEITPGSILLPATRRGKYLANIVRRQATDGTELRFSKDADRLNAEARKKADVLGEELLPYIIAEQERRVALHRRVMEAIQSGERGVTIAEMRNKPPVFIKKGLLYRCPKNRQPIEPDASGNITCEENIKPSQVTYDSCLYAEDRELIKTENSIFFCNRRNKSLEDGSQVKANNDSSPLCPPTERTWLNYTQSVCALEESYDVVVHYRYYADKTNKQIMELDPDREVCDHWSPCQVGYLFALPTPDTAVFIQEQYSGEPSMADFEMDEYVEGVAEDFQTEFVKVDAPYKSSPRIVEIPEGQSFVGMQYKDEKGNMKDLPSDMVRTTELETRRGRRTRRLISLFFPIFYTFYYTRFYYCLTFGCSFYAQYDKAQVEMDTKELTVMNGQILPEMRFKVHSGSGYRFENVMFRNEYGKTRNLRRYQYTGSNREITLDLGEVDPDNFGEYLALFSGFSQEQRIRFLTIEEAFLDIGNEISMAEEIWKKGSLQSYVDYEQTVQPSSCEVLEVSCRGHILRPKAGIRVLSDDLRVNFRFRRFTDENACVYMGLIAKRKKKYQKILAVYENDSPNVKVTSPIAYDPKKYLQSDLFNVRATIECSAECQIEAIYCNQLLIKPNRQYKVNDLTKSGDRKEIVFNIENFEERYVGVFQITVEVNRDNVTKVLLWPTTVPGGSEVSGLVARSTEQPEKETSEAITTEIEAITTEVEAITTKVEAITTEVQAITTEVEAITTEVEAYTTGTKSSGTESATAAPEVPANAVVPEVPAATAAPEVPANAVVPEVPVVPAASGAGGKAAPVKRRRY